MPVVPVLSADGAERTVVSVLLEEPFSTLTADVPCDGCRRCCVNNDLVRLMRGDDVSAYVTESHPLKKGHVMLAHKANGECLYLGPDGCQIHERRPIQCRTMDCRNIARRVTYSQARKLGLIRIWRKGRELDNTNPPR